MANGIYELKLSSSEDIKRHFFPFLLWGVGHRRLGQNFVLARQMLYQLN